MANTIAARRKQAATGTQTPEAVLLAAAGLHTAFKPKTTPATPPPAEETSAPVCSDAAVRYLRMLSRTQLGKAYPELVMDWCLVAHERGEVVPMKAVPHLEFFGECDSRLRSYIARVIGKRGRALVRDGAPNTWLHWHPDSDSHWVGARKNKDTLADGGHRHYEQEAVYTCCISDEFLNTIPSEHLGEMDKLVRWAWVMLVIRWEIRRAFEHNDTHTTLLFYTTLLF